MNYLFSLVRKDLKLEGRRRELFAVNISISILLSIIAAYGIQGAFLEPLVARKIFPIFLWMIFVFSSTISITRSFEYEVEDGALRALSALHVPPAAIYMSKVIVNFLALAISHLLAVLLLSIGLDVPVPFTLLASISIPVVAAYSALGTLLSAIAVFTKLRGVLLPIILLPLLFPLFFAACELTTQAFLNGAIRYDSFWFTLLISLDVVYLALGIVLFEYVICE